MRRSSQINRLELLVILGILLLLFILASFNATWATANQQETIEGNAPASLYAPAANYTLYLPLVLQPYICGVGGTVPCRIPNTR